MYVFMYGLHITSSQEQTNTYYKKKEADTYKEIETYYTITYKYMQERTTTYTKYKHLPEHTS